MLLTAKGITKRFGPIESLRGVDLDIGEAEAVGLVGDNGAGKSTLVKILAGVFAPTSGSLTFAQAPARFTNPLDARATGIEMIYQDLALCPDLSVAANVFLGRELRRSWGPLRLLDRRAMDRDASRVLAELGTDVAPGRLTGTLSGGERQLVAVARALEFQPRLFLMDEPTAALSNQKIHALLSVVKQLKERGVAVLLVSHRFTDVIGVCDRIVVIRQGTVAGEVLPAAMSAEAAMAQLTELMSGESL